MESHDLFFCPEPKGTQKNLAPGTSRLQKQMIGQDMCNHILFIHALLGCDTISRYLDSTELERGASLKRFIASHAFREQAKVFDTYSASMHDVVDAGEKALVIISNGKSTDMLDSLRHQRFCEKVA